MMRWFVEVSRLGASETIDKYCIEAQQWQSALQEARKLRGESGPLSRFSIELLDDGYRALDPTLKLRYVVNRAPEDAPLGGVGTNGQQSPASEAPRTEVAAPPTLAAASARKAPIVVPDDEVPRAVAPQTAPVAQKRDSMPEGMIRPTVPSLVVARPPDFQLVRKREEEPSEQTPIAYREYAYAVSPGTDDRAAEALLWARFREILSSLEGTPAGKFVQLAVFDHIFEKRPVRPPIATLAWKDWRGDPVVQFARAPKPASKRPPEPEPEVVPTARVRARASEPAAAMPRRRKSGVGLISELFETMHELHYFADVVSGVEFVVGILERTVPCDGIMVHVFDINTNSFVLVRAKGPNAEAVLLTKTPDREPLFDEVMRRAEPLTFDDASGEIRFQTGRWPALGITPHAVLCGGVKQGGRYLGLIELANPLGGEPFYASEVNALDYICEQLAELLANRPIVLDADVVLPRA
jgi:GAF domain-containing protein